MSTAAALRLPDASSPVRETPASARHVPALDGIRGIAILLVLAHNLNVLTAGGAAARAVGLVMDLGWIGVQLFFVLSGYLITGILLDSRGDAHYYRAFYGRRTVRIFPLYYAVLFATFVIAPLALHRPVPGHEHQIWLWTYLANWAEPFGRTVPVFPHFWSLSIEEQFYLAWPLLVRHLSPRALLTTIATLAALALASRIALRASGAVPDGPYMFTICRVDALVLGAAGAVLLRRQGGRDLVERWRRPLRWGALALIVITILATRGAPRTGVLTQTYGYTLLAVAFAALVVDAATARDWPSRILNVAPLRAAGRYSYAMYIFHTPLHLLIGLPLIARIASHGVGLPLALGYLAAATAVTFAAAFASYHLLEKHFLRLKDRFSSRAA